MLFAAVSLNRKVSCATMPTIARNEARFTSRTSRPSTFGPAGDIVKPRRQIGQGSLARSAGPHQRNDFARLHFQIETANVEAFRGAGVAERNVFENDGILEPRQLRSVGLLDDLLDVIEILENFLRRDRKSVV